MSILTDHFCTDRKIFLPVIHAVSAVQLREQVLLACEAGGDGALCISHGLMYDSEVVSALAGMQAKREIPLSFCVGLNALGRPAPEVVALIDAFGGERSGISLLWSDEGPGNAARQARMALARETHDWHGLYLAGAAFKYQTPVPADQYATVAAEIAGACDIVTTSGPGTGKPADLHKLRVMSAATRAVGVPLAVASGVDLGNVDAQARAGVDVFLVASSLETRFGALDRERVAELAGRIHAHARHLDPEPADDDQPGGWNNYTVPDDMS